MPSFSALWSCWSPYFWALAVFIFHLARWVHSWSILVSSVARARGKLEVRGSQHSLYLSGLTMIMRLLRPVKTPKQCLFKKMYLYLFTWLHCILLAAHGTFVVSLQHTDPLVGVHGLSCSMACGILDPQPGIEPASAALQSGFLISGPPRKSPKQSLEQRIVGLQWSALLALPNSLWKAQAKAGTWWSRGWDEVPPRWLLSLNLGASWLGREKPMADKPV